MPSVAVVCIDDGRYDYLQQCVRSLQAFIPQSLIEAQILIQDAGDETYSNLLRSEFPQFDRQVHHETRRGLGGAVHSAWSTALEYDVDYVWHQEGDFVLTEPLPLSDMAYLLMTQQRLAQLVLKRQSGNAHEAACGGLVETAPDEYEELYADNLVWTEHRRVFSFNPCLIPRAVVECALKNCDNFLERDVSDVLLAHGYTFALWGGKFDPPRVQHVGDQRSSGYKW
jgi:hypothetical protein